MPTKKAKTKPTPTPADQLSEYEALRLAHIKRNQEFLESLGLFSMKEEMSGSQSAAKSKNSKPRVKPPPMPQELMRRSARVKQEKPEYTGEKIDKFGEELDAIAGKVSSSKRKLAASFLGGDEVGDENIDYEAMQDEMRESAMQHMQQVRMAMLPTAIADETNATSDEWREEAVRRWGPAAGAGPRSDWKAYVQSRLSTPPPVSPLDFLQEYYAADVWRLLVSCILMSRVSSFDTKHRCISAFFSLYPTPSSFLDETNWSRVKGMIHSLGLFDDRLKSLIALTTRFIGADVFSVNADNKSEHKIHGIGAFGYESYLVFCRDEGASIRLSDGGRPIAPFVVWRKKLAASTGETDDSITEQSH